MLQKIFQDGVAGSKRPNYQHPLHTKIWLAQPSAFFTLQPERA